MTEMPIPEDIRSASNAVISTVFGDGYFDPTLWEAIAEALMAERERTNRRWRDSDEEAKAAGMMLTHFDVSEAVLAERERAAKIAIGFDDGDPQSDFSQAAGTIARAIRNQA